MKPDIKAVIFDMGGVLVRCVKPEIREELGKPYGLTREQLETRVFVNPVAELASVGKASDDELWQHIGQLVGVPAAEVKHFREAFWSADDVNHELVGVIKALRKHYKTGLLSNAWIDARQSLTSKYPHMMDSFDVSVFSAEVGMVKPDPAFYHWILERLQVKPAQAVFVDDFVENIEAAKALGIHAIRFVNNEQALADLHQVVAW